MAHMKSRDGSGSSTGGGNKGGDKNKDDKASTLGERESTAGRDDTCGYSGKKVHWAHMCRKKKHDEEA
jgi:hypothetical protein